MAYARRTDGNHAAIVADLRKAGCTVVQLFRAGNDAPDLAVGLWGITCLVEVKQPKGKATAGQSRAIAGWEGGPWIVATTAEEVLSALGDER